MTRTVMLVLIGFALITSAESAQFTSVDNGADWTHTNVWNEIIAAWELLQEAAEFCDGDTYVPLYGVGRAYSDTVVGEDMQEKDYVKHGSGTYDPRTPHYSDIQESLDEMVSTGVFIDTNAVATNFGVPQTFSLTSWYVRAGMTTNGWRRSTSYDPDVNVWTNQTDAMYSYGYVQAGDIIGNWVFRDIQNAILVLDTTYKSSFGTQGSNAEMEREGSSGFAGSSFTNEVAQMAADWAGDGVYTSAWDSGHEEYKYYGYGTRYTNGNYILNEYANSVQLGVGVDPEDTVLTTNAVVVFYALPYLDDGSESFFSSPEVGFVEGKVKGFATTLTTNHPDHTNQFETAVIGTHPATVTEPNDAFSTFNLEASYPTTNVLYVISEGVRMHPNNGSWWQVTFERPYSN